MPNCDFFAAGPEHRSILDFLLAGADCDIYESYSPFEKPLRQLRCLSDFETRYSVSDWQVGSANAILLQLYVHGAGGRFVNRRINLIPERCDGATFRHAAEGWGLIQLYLESPRDGRLRNSHTNHNSAKRAATWFNVIDNLGDPAEWDWARVSSFSSRLNRFIRSLAVGKIGSRAVLPHAAMLQAGGIVLG